MAKQPKKLTRDQKIKLSAALKKMGKNYDVKEFAVTYEDKECFVVLRKGHTLQLTIPY